MSQQQLVQPQQQRFDKTDPANQKIAFGRNDFNQEELAKIKNLLRQKLGPEHTKTRPGPGGSELTYVEGFKAVELANEVFDFDGWGDSIVDITPDFIEEYTPGRWRVAVTCVIRVTLKDGVYHEDVGFGCAENPSKATAIENAKKSAVSDARKRAFRLFGNYLGNCLYDKGYVKTVNVQNGPGQRGNRAPPALPQGPPSQTAPASSSSHPPQIPPSSSQMTPQKRLFSDANGQHPLPAQNLPMNSQNQFHNQNGSQPAYSSSPFGSNQQPARTDFSPSPPSASDNSQSAVRPVSFPQAQSATPFGRPVQSFSSPPQSLPPQQYAPMQNAPQFAQAPQPRSYSISRPMGSSHLPSSQPQQDFVVSSGKELTESDEYFYEASLLMEGSQYGSSQYSSTTDTSHDSNDLEDLTPPDKKQKVASN